jgi:hypothetical protein
MFPRPTADPAAARINPILPEKLPLFDISYSNKISVKPLSAKNSLIDEQVGITFLS